MFRTILLAVDVNDLEGCERPAAVATQLAQTEGAALHVMNVVPDFGMAIVGSHFDESHNKEILGEAKAALTAWAESRFAGVSELRLHVDQGSIYDLVLREAKSIGADVIVVGAHKSTLQDYLVGPNAARIARHATQSVFVVR